MIGILGHGVEKGADPSALLDSNVIESSPVIRGLETQFLSMIPPRFGNIRTFISPTPNLNSVIRADCQNKGCGVRTFIHITRIGGEWQFANSTPTFDRLQSATCGDCRNKSW